MGHAMAHRGPDEQSMHVYGRAGLVFRRLAIIDVAGGSQPIDDEANRIHVILNGEIYNHLELRADLEKRGHVFKTLSDVEVVVHGYEVWGDDVVERLRGMFALALWDERDQRLLLARDRFGKKPLLYHHGPHGLIFASEFRALLAHPALKGEPNLQAIHHYLTFQYVPTPLTAFEGVFKIPPGHIMTLKNGDMRLRRYWRLTAKPPLRLDEAEAALEVRRLLREAVRRRLMSEVPLGAFLSGGVDSSTVVALMASFGRVKTFSIGFAETDYDETAFAREVSTRYATDHHEFIVRPDAAEIIPSLVDHYGEPFADSSALPTFYLSRLTAQHVTVALSGDGGDELFGGYERYKFLPQTNHSGARRESKGPLGALSSLAARFRPSGTQRGAVIDASAVETYGRMMSFFGPDQKQAIYAGPMLEATRPWDSYALLAERFASIAAEDFLAQVLMVEAETYLPDDILVKVDIASMAHSLEVRAPFLDQDVAEFVGRLPSRFKLNGGVGKKLLRAAIADLLPPSVLERKKMGFGVPLAAWFRGDLAELIRESLLGRPASGRGLFNVDSVGELLRQHVSGQTDHSSRLWALFMLELWFQRFIDQQPKASASVAH